MMQRGRGYKPDPVGHLWNPFAALEASELAADDLPAMVDLRAFAPPVFDQGMTSSCVGHATATAIYTAVHVAGLAVLNFIPSPAGIYKMALCLGNLDAGLPKTAPIVDRGCAPNEAVRGINEWGVFPLGPRPPDGRFSDADPATITVKPRLDELEADTPVTGLYPIESSGLDFVVDVKRSLASGYPVTFAVCGDNLAYSGQPLGPQLGAPDHYMCAIGYRTVGTQTVMIFRNSWGIEFGVSGDAEGDEGFMDSVSIAYAVRVLE